jgi:hypothetical protein
MYLIACIKALFRLGNNQTLTVGEECPTHMDRPRKNIVAEFDNLYCDCSTLFSSK